MKFIDLFAGVGGIRSGFEHVGWECVFTSELNKYAKETYLANYPNSPIHDDVTTIIPSELPKFDALMAGFPCQPFSRAGKEEGFLDTRGTLFFNIADIISVCKPSVVFLENVRNLVSHDDGNTFKVIIRALNDLGYKVYHKILNSKNFGVPQTRSRIYIVCFRSDDVNSFDLPDEEFHFPNGPQTLTRVGDILEENVSDKYMITDKMWLGHQERKARNKAAGKGFGYTMVDENSPYTNTITARYYKDGAEILIKQDGKNPRVLTPREAARLQGFPDSFVIPVSDTQAYKQFGNSVAVPVIKAIAERIQNHVQTRRPSDLEINRSECESIICDAVW